MWSADFQLKRSKVKVTGCKNHTKLASFTYGRPIADQAQADPASTANSVYAIVITV